MTPPRALSPNARVFWGTRNRAFQGAKSATFYAFRDTINLNDPGDCFQREPWPLRLSYVVAWEKGHRRMDDDNCKASTKAFTDGVATALGIDDKNFILGDVRQVRDKEGLGYVLITVETVEAIAERRSV